MNFAKKPVLTRIAAVLCAVICLFFSTIVSVNADASSEASSQLAVAVVSGWQNIAGKWRFCAQNGEYYKNGLYKINGRKYLFDADGNMLTGINRSGKKLYYFSASKAAPEKGKGALCEYRGWKTISGNIYYFSAGHSASVGLKKINKKIFYFGDDGRLATGWKKIGKSKYFFKTGGKTGSKGKKLKNCMAGDKKSGYGYVDSRGRKIISNEMKLAVKLIVKHTKLSDSKGEKLGKCYEYIKKHYSYSRVLGLPNSKNISKKFAARMFRNKTGNCFCYASAFACVAKALGYEARINAGTVTTPDGGPSVHGWTEVKIGKQWYLFDISLHRHNKKVNLYKVPNGRYPYEYKRESRYSIGFGDNKLIWKKG